MTLDDLVTLAKTNLPPMTAGVVTTREGVYYFGYNGVDGTYSGATNIVPAGATYDSSGNYVLSCSSWAMYQVTCGANDNFINVSPYPPSGVNGECSQLLIAPWPGTAVGTPPLILTNLGVNQSGNTPASNVFNFCTNHGAITLTGAAGQPVTSKVNLCHTNYLTAFPLHDGWVLTFDQDTELSPGADGLSEKLFKIGGTSTFQNEAVILRQSKIRVPRNPLAIPPGDDATQFQFNNPVDGYPTVTVQREYYNTQDDWLNDIWSFALNSTLSPGEYSFPVLDDYGIGNIVYGKLDFAAMNKFAPPASQQPTAGDSGSYAGG
jgi:hypothetical protein